MGLIRHEDRLVAGVEHSRLILGTEVVAIIGGYAAKQGGSRLVAGIVVAHS